MNAAQRGMYHAEKAKWQQACKALGRPHDDAALRALHAAHGAPHSSTQFSQDDITRVIGAFRAVSDMGNFDAQMQAQGTLKERHLEDIKRLAGQLDIKRGLAGVSAYYRQFLGGISVERHGDTTLGKLVGMMKARAAKLAKPAAPEPAPSPAEPFDAEDHLG